MSPASPATTSTLAGLNPAQRNAAQHGDGPLLIVAGAGTGKTRTLVHRVASLIERGVEPGRVLLLTFTRRAAAEMLRRVDELLTQQTRKKAEGPIQPTGAGKKVWGGTFHAVSSRLLRMYGKATGLPPDFTIHDRSDSEDLMNVLRTERGLSKTDKRFPKKRTCMAIYSYCVNAQRPLDDALAEHFPWCKDCVDELKTLFRMYVDRKESGGVLDYDDLLLFWHDLLADDKVGERIRDRFDHVLVDEYQDTNLLQAGILSRLRPDGTGLTVVGDDAQSIYSFRAATVDNILDFPKQFSGTEVVKLQQNYRSTQPILEVTNRVIGEAKRRHKKELFSERTEGEKPQLVYCEDEEEQSEAVIRRVLTHYEAGIPLHRQAVLFRTSHHSADLETALSRQNIPFVKYGGLKFLEAAHVKDLMAFLRLAENPGDLVAGTRVLNLLPGVGPKKAQQLMDLLAQAHGDFEVWKEFKPPAAAKEFWLPMSRLFVQLRKMPATDVTAQMGLVRGFYAPLLEKEYENSEPRLRDLEMLEQMADRYADRRTMLTEAALDPPTSTQDLAGPPLLDEDFLILSTIHSAKGLEWDAVNVIHAADGCIPSDMSTGKPEQIEEERRLLYVALTRAKSWLYVHFPMRYYQAARGWRTDRFGMPQISRFLTGSAQAHFQATTPIPDQRIDEAEDIAPPAHSLRRRSRSLWE